MDARMVLKMLAITKSVPGERSSMPSSWMRRGWVAAGCRDGASRVKTDGVVATLAPERGVSSGAPACWGATDLDRPPAAMDFDCMWTLLRVLSYPGAMLGRGAYIVKHTNVQNEYLMLDCG